MRPFGRQTVLLAIVALIAGCASSEIAKPNRIIVRDFAATPADLPTDAAVAGHYDQPATRQTAEEIEVGRELGKRVAARLVEDLRGMGLPAERAASGPPPQPGDVVIQGEFVAIDGSNPINQMVIGFRAGEADLQTFVEVDQLTAAGLRPLGQGEVNVAGANIPGMLMPVAGAPAVGQKAGAETIEDAAKRTADEIGKVLAGIFKRRGWIA